MMEYGIYKPMKYAVARTTDILKEALNSPDYCLQLKRDGASYVWAKDLDGSVHLYGDRISKKTGEVIDKIDNVPHMRNFAEDYFPNGSAVIVEMCAHWDYAAGKPIDKTKSSYVNGIMLCKPEKAEERQRMYGKMEAYMFDVLFWDKFNYAHDACQDRIDFMESIHRQLLHMSKDKYPDAEEWFTVAESIYENKDEVIQKWLADGEEGGVLKLLYDKGNVSSQHVLRSLNSTAARPMHTTYKIKQVDSVDVVITKVLMPAKEYTGLPENVQFRDDEGNPVNRLWFYGFANSFQIGAYTDDGDLYIIGTVASGLNDEVRYHAALHPEDFIGQTISVTCMSLDKDSFTIRHPRFTQMRPDKDPKDCLLSEIFK